VVREVHQCLAGLCLVRKGEKRGEKVEGGGVRGRGGRSSIRGLVASLEPSRPSSRGLPIQRKNVFRHP
jgi:hypothetical protein